MTIAIDQSLSSRDHRRAARPYREPSSPQDAPDPDRPPPGRGAPEPRRADVDPGARTGVPLLEERVGLRTRRARTRSGPITPSWSRPSGASSSLPSSASSSTTTTSSPRAPSGRSRRVPSPAGSASTCPTTTPPISFPIVPSSSGRSTRPATCSVRTGTPRWTPTRPSSWRPASSPPSTSPSSPEMLVRLRPSGPSPHGPGGAPTPPGTVRAHRLGCRHPGGEWS